MNDCDSTVVNKTYVLYPTIVPTPSQPKWKYETRIEKRKKQISINFNSLTNGSRCNDRHLNTESKIKYKFGIISIYIINTHEVILPYNSTFCIERESKPNTEKRDGRDWDYKYCFQQYYTIILHFDCACFFHHISNLRQNNHNSAY